jgi:toxin ParE1/3/4
MFRLILEWLSELPKIDYLEIIVGPCRIFYRTDKNKVYIPYIMRSDRKLRLIVLEDRVSMGR